MGEFGSRPQRPKSRREIELVATSLADPLDGRLITLLATRGNSGVSELAEWTEEPEQVIRRRLKGLVEDGLVSAAKVESRRGTAKRYYTSTFDPLFSAEAEERLSEQAQRLLALGILRLLFAEATAALSAGRLTARPDRVISSFPAEVDEAGWRELARLHAELLARVMEVVDESKERLARTGADPVAVLCGLVLTERDN